MGMPIVKEYGQEKTILKFFPHKNAACVVPQSMGVDQADGRKLVIAGTPFPADDDTCLGLLLYTVDVTAGDEAGAYVYEGVIDPDKLTENGVTVSDAAKKVIPNVQFYKEPYKA